MPSLPRSVVFFSAALWVVAGCRRDEVTHFRTPKEQAAGAPGAAPMGMGSAPSADVPPPPAPSERGSLKWTLPKGWAESKTGGMRYATLKPPVDGKIDVSVVVLPGPAGGELANVNRWRGQIGLAAVSESDLPSMRRIVRTKAGPVAVYELESEGTVKSHMTGAVLQAADGNTWFIKMVGDAGAVAKARADFAHLLESIRFD